MGAHTYSHSTRTVDGVQIDITYTHFTGSGVLWDAYAVLDGEQVLLTEESVVDYPDDDEIRELLDGNNIARAVEDTDLPPCFSCGKTLGPDYHIVGVISEPTTYCCDDCWDERLR